MVTSAHGPGELHHALRSRSRSIPGDLRCCHGHSELLDQYGHRHYPVAVQRQRGSGPGYGVANSVDHTTGTGNFAWFDGSYSTSIPTLTVVPVDISTLTTPMVSIWVKANNTNDAALNTLKVQANNGTGWVDLIAMRRTTRHG